MGRSEVGWRDRHHFHGAAARAMRHIMIDHARKRRADKRGGGRTRLSLDAVESWLAGGSVDQGVHDEALLAVERSLERLEKESPRQCRVVECRFFAELTIRDTADALDISPATVKRDWTSAQAWLYRDLLRALGTDGGAPDP